MLSTIKVVNYGGSNGITFYVSVDTNSFDYQLMSRECTVKLYAECSLTGAVIESFQADGSLSIFGKTFVLPQSITISETGNTVIGEYVISGITEAVYPSSAVCNVNLSYRCSQITMSDCSQTFDVAIGKIHLAPVCTPVGSGRFAIGSKVVFSGDVFSEGYVVNASVKYGRVTNYEYSLESKGNGFYTRDDWMIFAESVNEFTATVTLSATYKGVPLPQTHVLQIVFYLPENKGLPSATVNTGFDSENEIAASLGVGIKNKTFFKIDVTNIYTFYGAYLSKCAIVIDGIEYVEKSAQTPLLTESGEHTWSVTVTDTRGRKTTYTGVFNVEDYSLPDFTVLVKRTDAEGNESKIGECIYLDFIAGAEYDFGGSNPYEYTFAYRAIGKDADLGESIPIENGVTIHNGGLNSALMYEVCVKGADSIGSETVKTFVLDCERIELNIAKNKVAVGRKAKKERVFECAWNIESDGDVAFTDDNGRLVSLKEYCRSLPLLYDSAYAKSENDISAALTEFESTERRSGGRILLLNVLSESLTLSKGLHIYIGHCDGQQFVFKKL